MTAKQSLFPWHQPYWNLFQQYFLQNRVPQALLISGQSGLGKHYLATQLAQALLCEQRDQHGLACGQCHSCLLFNAETHPDYMRVEPEEAGKAIGVDRIRQLLPVLALKPQFSGFRVVIIADTEQLNVAAANAFLKCLEEPNERTVILLVTSNVGRLPATIISRCQQLKIKLPEREQACDWLTAQSVTKDQAVLLDMAAGSPLTALAYAQDNKVALRNICFDEWQKLAQHQLAPTIVAENWLKLAFIPLLNWVSSWVADLIKCRLNIPASYLSNPDLYPLLQEAQKRLDLRGLFGLYDLLLTTHKQAHTQLNKQLLIEVILIEWFNLNSRDKDYG